MNEARAEGESFSPGRCLMGKKKSTESKKDNKMAILCNLQAKEGSSIKYRKRIHQYWKNYGLLELQKQHLAYQVSSILKTGRLSKVEIKRLKRQIKQLHVDSVGCGTGEFDKADEEVVTQDNVLLQEFTAGASDYFEDTSAS